MLKQKYKKSRLGFKLSAGLVAVVLTGTIFGYAAVMADQFDAQIQMLQDQNSANQANSNLWASQANSYQDAVNALDSQINSIQQAIVSTQSKIDDLQNQITAAQNQLDQERKTLGENIKTMYLEGNISTLEILASSKNISEYVDKQQYRNAVQNKVKDSVDKIAALKVELQSEQRSQQTLLANQQAQRNDLSAKESQQSQMLAFSEGQKAAYDSQIKANNSQIASLRAQQAAANRRLGGTVVSGDPGHGGYPAYWDYPVAQDSLLDDWGMLNRECVSYTAWKVYQAYGTMPYWGGQGNANQWPGDARAAGIPTGSTPKVGSVAISMGGYYGHAMWVEAVNGSMIYVSQYNFNLDGRYSEMWVNGSNFTYIYFGG